MTNTLSKSRVQNAKPVPCLLSYELPAFEGARLYVPYGSRHVPAEDWCLYDQPIPEVWQQIAQAKGFRVTHRLRDRYHVALECGTCGGLTAQKVFALRTAQPACGACAHSALERVARQAGLTYLGRNRDHQKEGVYRLPCGHEVTRQFELVERMAKGTTGVRCEICQTAKEEQEAQAQGWQRVGGDPEGDPNYRLYEHDCGHIQRIARVNMQTGRLLCENCGEGWAAATSYIYAMRFVLPEAGTVIKLGFARDPKSRLHHQLKRRPSVQGDLLRQVAMPTGHAAICAEKKMHTFLKKTYPEAVVAHALFRAALTVKSEIYTAEMEPVILGMLEDLQSRMLQ